MQTMEIKREKTLAKFGYFKLLPQELIHELTKFILKKNGATCNFLLQEQLIKNNGILASLKSYPRKNVECVAWHPNITSLFAAQKDSNIIEVWDLQKEICKYTLRCLKAIKDIAWNPNNQSLAVASDCSKVIISEESGKCHFFEGHTEPVNTVRWGSHNNILASGSCDGTIRIWNSNICKQELKKPKCSSSVACIDWNPKNENEIAAGYNYPYEVSLWDVEYKKNKLLQEHTAKITNIAWNTSNRFASASWDKTIRIWNMQDEKSDILIGHNMWVSALAWQPHNDTILASGSYDRTVCLWDLRMNKIAYRHKFSRFVYALAFCPQVPYKLAIATGDGVEFLSLADEKIYHDLNSPSLDQSVELFDAYENNKDFCIACLNNYNKKNRGCDCTIS